MRRSASVHAAEAMVKNVFRSTYSIDGRDEQAGKGLVATQGNVGHHPNTRLGAVSSGQAQKSKGDELTVGQGDSS